MIQDFYDQLAPYYHLIFEDWQASIDRQGNCLDAIIRAEWGPSFRTVLDAAAGIGTQALGLATRGYQVTASDLSPAKVGLEPGAKQSLVACHWPLRQPICVSFPRRTANSIW
jgi:2-polyprenyl-3-methyl-5-hydroxy-6-metoxy-1,4-benzoquinol methylase